jgi:hypothetical protein
MTNKVKNQHFVPQFYLRQFCDPKGKLYVFDKPQEKVFPSPTEDVAASKYFYDLDPSMLRPGVNPQIVENALAKAETQYSLAIETTLASLREKSVLCADALPVVAEFMAVQVMRTREVRTQMQQMNKLLEHVLKDSPEAKAKYVLPDGGDNFVQAMLLFGGASEETKEILCNHIWIGARNVSNRPLITSDNPIVRNPHITSELMSNTGLGSLGIEIFLPLNPQFGVILLEREYHASMGHHEMLVVDMNEENVEFYNGHQVLQSDRQVFSNEDAFLGVRALLQRRPDVKNPKRQRSEFIWGGRRISLDDV